MNSLRHEKQDQIDYSIHQATPGERESHKFQQWLSESLIKNFPDLRIKEYLSSTPDWFQSCDYLIYALDPDSNEAVGLLTSRWRRLKKDIDYLHATAQFVIPRLQGSYVLRDIWKKQLILVSNGEKGLPGFIVYKTCNPSAFRPMHMFSEVDGIDVYPTISGEMQSPTLRKYAEEISKQICPEQAFNSSNGVISNISVPPDFYPKIPVNNKATKLTSYFLKHLTPQDRILCIANIKSSDGARTVLKAFGVDTNLQST